METPAEGIAEVRLWKEDRASLSKGRTAREQQKGTRSNRTEEENKRTARAGKKKSNKTEKEQHR